MFLQREITYARPLVTLAAQHQDGRCLVCGRWLVEHGVPDLDRCDALYTRITRTGNQSIR